MSERKKSRYWLAHFGDDHPASKVTEVQRAEGIRRIVEDYEPPKCIAMDLGVKESTVCMWVRNAGYIRGYVPRRKKHAGR